MKEQEHEIRMKDGSIRSFTAKEVSAKTGLSADLIRNRIRKGIRDWVRLTESAEAAKKRARQAFLRGTEAIFAERAKERASEEAHERMVLGGNPKI